MINRVILLLAFLVATTHAGVFDSLFGGSDQDQKKKKVERNEKGTQKGRQRTRPVRAVNEPVNEQQETKEILTDEAIVDNITPEDDLKATPAQIHEAWTKHMHDFVPDDLINFIVEQGTALVFYDKINHLTPSLVKGAYYVHGGGADNALPLEGFMIQDPIKDVIYKRSNEVQGLILFNTTTAGEYTFIFANFKGTTDLAVTLALHTYEVSKEAAIEFDFLENDDRVIRGSVVNEGEQKQGPYADQISEIAGDEEISIVRNHLRTIQTNCKNVQTETKLSFMRQEDHNQDMQQNGDWFFKAMLLEVFCFLVVLAYQLHHLKVSLDNKLVL